MKHLSMKKTQKQQQQKMLLNGHHNPAKFNQLMKTFVLDGIQFFLLIQETQKKTEYEKLSLSTINNQDPEEPLNSESFATANDSGAKIGDGKFPRGSAEHYGLNQWSHHHENPNLFIRNQSRTTTETRGISQSDIELSNLPIENPAMNTPEARFLFNATSWSEAIKTIESGIEIKERRNDLSVDGAFYCNPDYPNCYEWFYGKKGSFGGEHAMMIYKFDPWKLKKNGETLTEEEWKSIVYKRNTKKCMFHWSEAPQNKAPSDFMKQGKHPIPCRLADGRTAEQLVVRSQAMCDKMNAYIVGCVFYEKLNDINGMSFTEQPVSQYSRIETSGTTNYSDAVNTTAKQSRYSYEQRKRKRQKSKDRSKTRDFKRFREE
jgi:hypothetical protein